MTVADIPRVIEIERLAYSTPWPPSAYRKELQDNPLAHYIIVRDTHAQVPARAMGPAESAPKRPFPLSLLPSRTAPVGTPELASTIAFAGLWLMMDEAHITTIAVHPDYRGRGIGELMLATLIGIAYDIHARNVTLEVRVSNIVAQNLYRKYGFREAGTRRRYYSDNHEDALIMWTDDLESPAYRSEFLRLHTALVARLRAQDPD
ncbi:MAG: ribosomal protein S18-alanine N-acetyltransferase [Ktedonobacterales bacterium]|nr:ribosomal protein S18-alanine N-acetyltransferase [Ktedonobacterales bacterium]